MPAVGLLMNHAVVCKLLKNRGLGGWAKKMIQNNAMTETRDNRNQRDEQERAEASTRVSLVPGL